MIGRQCQIIGIMIMNYLFQVRFENQQELLHQKLYNRKIIRRWEVQNQFKAP